MSRTSPIRNALAAALAVALLSAGATAAELAVLRNGFTIQHQRREIVGDTTRLFLDSGTSSYVDVPTAEIQGFEKDLSIPPAREVEPGAVQPAALDLNQVVNSVSATYRLDPDFINSVILAESGFNSRAVSRKGAQGLMQLMPGTAVKLGVKNPMDPQANVDGGTRYLRELLERYNFDVVKALAAYNAGPQRVEQYRGVPPYRETRAYVAKIVHDYNRKKIAQEKAEAAAKLERSRKTPTSGTKQSAGKVRGETARAEGLTKSGASSTQ